MQAIRSILNYDKYFLKLKYEGNWKKKKDVFFFSQGEAVIFN